MDTSPQAFDEAADRRRRILAIIGGSSGNLVEWYDFYAYSFTALYFAPLFFPAGDRTTQLLSAAGVFAVGFLVRPIGGWFFGRLADRRGRRFAMMTSVLLMCFGSLVIAILPTHAGIGLAAPVLLTLARLAQGLSVGGEYGTSATYMSEVAAPGHRGFYASFQYVTLIGGQLLAVLVIVLLELLVTEAQMRAWGWRIPFVVGAAAAIVALFLRRALHETQSASAARRPEAGSLRGLLRHPKPLLLVLGLTAGGSLSFYTFTTFMQKYLVNTAGFAAKTTSATMAVVLLVFMLAQPAFGALSDHVGRRTMLLAFGALGAVMTVPVMTAIGRVDSPVIAALLVLGALAVVSCYTSISGLVKAELFPGEVRALGVGLPYAIANALFGGTAEYVGLWFKSIGAESGFFWYVACFFVLALLTAWAMPETRIESHLSREHGAR
ncbi:MFS transporter [Siccirubricoccus sp. KC 17139]|uniref:MFS transporter n=1 Tax=Siccirubricoccus soli TaxID=2899147 RepID=A0ABT1CZ32_9PROT|nr:MFS family transporter [Siccirubricoccus soli]MCO6414907.1 MFS transporter [Siccirubricoccus soli]MCP2681037.1 MFS family transporter [Siccirubricoccus soli]